MDLLPFGLVGFGCGFLGDVGDPDDFAGGQGIQTVEDQNILGRDTVMGGDGFQGGAFGNQVVQTGGGRHFQKHGGNAHPGEACHGGHPLCIGRGRAPAGFEDQFGTLRCLNGHLNSAALGNGIDVPGLFQGAVGVFDGDDTVAGGGCAVGGDGKDMQILLGKAKDSGLVQGLAALIRYLKGIVGREDGSGFAGDIIGKPGVGGNRQGIGTQQKAQPGCDDLGMDFWCFAVGCKGRWFSQTGLPPFAVSAIKRHKEIPYAL